MMLEAPPGYRGCGEFRNQQQRCRIAVEDVLRGYPSGGLMRRFVAWRLSRRPAEVARYAAADAKATRWHQWVARQPSKRMQMLGGECEWAPDPRYDKQRQECKRRLREERAREQREDAANPEVQMFRRHVARECARNPSVNTLCTNAARSLV